jgi:hypothetical protein
MKRRSFCSPIAMTPTPTSESRPRSTNSAGGSDLPRARKPVGDTRSNNATVPASSPTTPDAKIRLGSSLAPASPKGLYVADLHIFGLAADLRHLRRHRADPAARDLSSHHRHARRGALPEQPNTIGIEPCPRARLDLRAFMVTARRAYPGRWPAAIRAVAPAATPTGRPGPMGRATTATRGRGAGPGARRGAGGSR